MRKSRQVTIKHIAHESCVSIATVSNLLNGNVNEMSADTLLRVQDVIRRLNYRPNQIARGLVTRRTKTVGLILAEIETPLFLQALTSIARDTREVGYGLLLLHARNVAEEQQAVDLLLEKQVDGIVFLSTSDLREGDHIRSLFEAQLPVVLINRAVRHEAVDQVNWDNEEGVYAAVDWLARNGHRRIAHLRGPALRGTTQDRLRGYRRALERHHIAFEPHYVQDGDYTAAPELWRRSTHALLSLQKPPTAIIAADDTVAAVVLETLREQGVDVPGEISIIGIDDQPSLSFLGLTTVKLPVVEACSHAIKLLIKRIADRHAEVQHMVLRCPLLERSTTAPARGAALRKTASSRYVPRSAPAPASRMCETRVGDADRCGNSLQKQEGEG